MIIKVLGSSPTLDVPPNGPKHDTRSNGPKDVALLNGRPSRVIMLLCLGLVLGFLLSSIVFLVWRPSDLLGRSSVSLSCIVHPSLSLINKRTHTVICLWQERRFFSVRVNCDRGNIVSGEESNISHLLRTVSGRQFCISSLFPCVRLQSRVQISCVFSLVDKKERKGKSLISSDSFLWK